jgi:hypothetical protein
VTKTSDNNDAYFIKTYYMRGFANSVVPNNKVVGVRLKALGKIAVKTFRLLVSYSFSPSVTYRRRQDSDTEILKSHLSV